MPPQEVLTPELSSQRAARQRIPAADRARSVAQGLRRGPMGELAEELRMSKKTGYAHSPSKAALLEGVLLDKFHRADEDFQAITSECTDDFSTGLHRLL